MNKPSILFMNRVYPPMRGATGRLLKDLAEALVRDGFEVSVISSGLLAGEENIAGVRVIRIKANERPKGSLAYMFIWFRMLILALKLKPCDVLVTLSDPPMIIVAGRIIAKLKKSRHINWCQDLYPDIIPALGIKMPRLFMKILKTQRIKAMKSCEGVVVCGRCMALHITRDGIDIKKIKVINNWADMELITTALKEKSKEKPKQNIDIKSGRAFDLQVKHDKRFQVLYAGNIGLAHPIDVVLDAAKEQYARGSDVEFVFVGNGERFDYIANRRAEMCLDNIRILPYQPAARLREVMEGGDIHLVTMSDDAKGFIVPCKAYSAFAVARPCIFIGPKNSEIAEVINDFGAGLVVSPDDVGSLMNAITYFRKSSDAWFNAHEGAKRARNAFAPKASMDKWAELIKGKL